MDEYASFRRFMQRFVSINFAQWQLLRTRLSVRRFEAGEVILHAGDPCEKIIFVDEGIARICILSEEGKEKTWAFVYGKEDAPMVHRFAIDYESFLKHIPSVLHIEALTPCRCIVIDAESTSWLYRKSRMFCEFGKKMGEEAYCYTHRHLIEQFTLSIGERYMRFCEEYRAIIDHIPQYHIAGYLGITPQYLSKLRNSRSATM